MSFNNIVPASSIIVASYRHKEALVRFAAKYSHDATYKGWVLAIIRNRYSSPAFSIDWDDAEGEVMAEVHRSEWVVCCPDCTGAMIAEPDEPLFFCDECLNSGNAGKPRRVVFIDREAVERALRFRPNPQTRNYLPATQGETLADIMNENLEHGVGIPTGV